VAPVGDDGSPIAGPPGAEPIGHASLADSREPTPQPRSRSPRSGALDIDYSRFRGTGGTVPRGRRPDGLATEGTDPHGAWPFHGSFATRTGRLSLKSAVPTEW
jgi:hypothetical protein